MAKSTAGPGARKIQGLLQKFHAEKSEKGGGPAFANLMRGMMGGAARSRTGAKKKAARTSTTPTRSTAGRPGRGARMGIDKRDKPSDLKKTFGSM